MRYVPQTYRDVLARGGLNPYREPNYILHWGGDAVRRLAVPDTLLAPYLAAWCLAEWHPRQDFGRERDWPQEMLPYPVAGAYVPLQVFRDCRLDSAALNPRVLAMMLAIALRARGVTLGEQARALRDARLAAEARNTARLADRLADAFPAFHGADATSASPRNSTRRLAEELERRLRLPNPFLRAPRGPSVGSLAARPAAA